MGFTQTLDQAENFWDLSPADSQSSGFLSSLYYDVSSGSGEPIMFLLTLLHHTEGRVQAGPRFYFVNNNKEHVERRMLLP